MVAPAVVPRDTDGEAPRAGEDGQPGWPAGEQDLWEAIGRLPPRHRSVIVLRFIEDRTEAETAQLLDCSVGTVKSQCAEALAKLRLDTALAPVADERSRS